MSYVVLGMHKSGTTLVAEMLHRAGIPMVEVEGQADYDSGNKWERESTVALDARVLGAVRVKSIDIEASSVPLQPSEDEVAEARRLVEELDAQGEWGFKDPRACLAWPLWREALDEPVIVGVYRHYGEVLQHYLGMAGRSARASRIWRLRLGVRVLARWCEHNERVLAALEEAGDSALLISYERLMRGDEELEHLRRFLGRELEDPRDPSKYRRRPGTDWRARVIPWLARLRGAGDASGLHARLEAKRAELLARL